MPRDRRRTYLNDFVFRSVDIGSTPTPPGIGQQGTSNPSRTDLPAHLRLISTPMTFLPNTGGGTPTPGAAAVVAGAGTINTQSSNCRVNPAGNVTGIILQPPQVAGKQTDGNFVVVLNESAFTLTFAADATSNVFNGTSITIPAKGYVAFVWDPLLNANAGLWVAGFSALAALSGNQAISGNMVITSTSANALAVGPAGTTNPSFNVDASTASAVTGLNIKSAASGGGLAVSVISSAAAENLTINAKGTGNVVIGGVSTGQVSIGRGFAGTVLFSSTTAALGTTQNSTPTAAQLLGGIVTQTSAVGAGTVTTPTGTVLSAAVAGITVGDTFETVFANLGGGFNLVITAGASGMTIIGNATVPSGKTAILVFVNTGANTWLCYVDVSA